MKINPEHFTIDESQLAEEWIAHPQRVYEYAQLAADIRKTLDELKRRDEVVRAEVGLSVRKNPEVYGIMKVTESLVDSAITTNDEVRESTQLIIDCKHKLDLAMAAVTAMENKKKALECIVQLHATSYFANPRNPKSIESQIDREYRAPGIAPKKKTQESESEPSQSRKVKVVD
jgi:response regulator RpfG family c-di-GMP phosphodiesterase